MKVGIITFHRVNNYGAVLQAYALQKTIRRLGFDCEIIDYRRKNVRDIFLWQRNKAGSLLKGRPDRQPYTNAEFIRMVCDTIFFNNRKVAAKFNAFRKHLPMSRPVNSDSVRQLNREYDLFLSGSDQVWNCGRVYLDKNYFLDFVEDDNRKGSYAASFGIKSVPDKYRAEYKVLLSAYRYLSVRESAGADIIRELTGREANVVLDPTLLLDKGEWSRLIGDGRRIKPAVVVYMLEYSEALLDFARGLSQRTGCPVHLLKKTFGHRLNEDYRTDVGPLEWLKELKEAEYVVTNSFHGVAFSINFNKQFYVEIARERIRGAMASRIEDILTAFQLTERLISPENAGSMDITEGIDYGKVNRRLEELRADSCSYLEEMLKHEKR